jgi:CHAT domain-containing protein
MKGMRALGIAAVLVLLAVSGDRLRSQVVPPGGTNAKLIRAALNDGRYADAERLAVDHVADAQAASDVSGVAKASDLLVEALTRLGKIGDARTVSLAERLIVDKTKLFGSGSVELVLSLNNLGTLSTARGEFAKSISLHQRALSIARQLVPLNDAILADTLERLTVPMIWLERFPEAQGTLSEARRIRDHESQSTPSNLAHALYLEALLRRWDGRYNEATAWLDRVSQTRLARAPDHPDNVATFELKGDLLFLKGDVRQAEQTWTETLTLAERTFGSTHPAVAPLLHRLAIVAQEFGDLTRKRELLERAMQIEPGLRVPCFAELPAILNDFGTLNNYLGDFQRARTFFIEALAKARQCLGPRHSLTTTIVHNQAVLAAAMGDLAQADALHRQVLRAWSERLGADHPFIANALDSVAEVTLSRGRTLEAVQLLERGLRLRTRALGPESPNVAFTLVALAGAMSETGAVGALEKVGQAIAIYDRGNRPQDPDAVAAAYLLRGSLLLRRGDYEGGRAAFAKALSERERVFGAAHPVTAQARAELASADFGLGSVETAVGAALDAEEVGRNHLRFTIRYLPERQALGYADKRPRGLDLALSAVANGASAERSSVLDALIRSRGVVLDELGARAQLTAQSADPVLASLNAAAAAARERFANLMLRSLTGGSPVSRANLDDARGKKEAAERALAERSASERAEVAQANVGLKDVRAMLPVGSALVAFVRYERTTIPASSVKSAPRTTASYIGFVIRSDTGAVDAVPLGSASTIESAVTAWRAQVDGRSIAAGIADAERAYRTSGAALRRRIWDPFSGLLQNVSQVFVVPDGAINLVSFAALPIGTNRYLIEEGPLLHYLSTERDIIAKTSQTAGRGMLAVGGPAYDDRAQRAGAASALREGCPAIGGLHFEDLPGSRLEAAEVAKIWSSGVRDSGDTSVLSGRMATKTTVKQNAIGRRVIHLATHGFFLQSPCRSPIAGTRAVGGLAPRAAPSPEVAENPLLLTGLAFAGANARAGARANRSDDGILTAEEVAGLNLQGTEWVVLSACDTGTGQIKAGEGVFGLRRAFQIAGARTIIMSLWSVEDRSTQIWMRYLYDARFNLQLSTPAAIRAAGAGMLKERRARRESTHPFFWAAFVAAGDWR